MTIYGRFVSLCTFKKDYNFDITSYQKQIEKELEYKYDIFVYSFSCDGEKVSLRNNKTIIVNPNTALELRAKSYLAFFKKVVELFDLSLNIDIGCLLDDLAHHKNDQDINISLFTFQKKSSQGFMLLPDLDFIVNNFFCGQEYFDDKDIENKLNKGLFVGSTTGISTHDDHNVGIINTIDNLKQGENLRFNLAMKYADSHIVDILLPNICQCMDDNVSYFFRQHKFCGGDGVSWHRQFNNRYLISIDGNGATCSRVAIALKSNSVLLKLSSEYELYYFRKLVPYEHYVPVFEHDDIDSLIESVDEKPGLSEYISNASKEFYRSYLTRPNIYRYMAVLLNEFTARFNEQQYRDNIKKINSRTNPLFVIGHASTCEDKWDFTGIAGNPLSQIELESIAIDFLDISFSSDNLSYQVIYSDFTRSNIVSGGVLTSHRDNHKSIVGVKVILSAFAKNSFNLKYRVFGIDSNASRWCCSGEDCFTAGFSHMNAIQIETC